MFINHINMIYYIYKIQNITTGEYYIGQRSSKYRTFDEDPYMGSGNWIKSQVLTQRSPSFATVKNLPSHFVKILLEYTTAEMINEKEKFYIGDLWLNDHLCKNECAGGIGIQYGVKNGAFDNTLYKWENSEGIIEHMTQYDFRNKYAFSQPAISALANGSIISHKKWFLYENREKYFEISKPRGRKHEKYEWKHENGKIEYSTIFEISKKYNLPKGKASAIVNGRQISCQGWYIDEQKFYNRKNFGVINENLYEWVNIDGSNEYMNGNDLCKKYNLEVSPICRVIKNLKRSYKGWSIK